MVQLRDLIVVRLRGGLGNQMFQYAAGRALALRRGCRLKLDLTDFDKASHRGFALDGFPIQAGPASPAEIRALKHGRRVRRLLRRWVGRGGPPRSFVQEPALTFQPEILDLRGPVYLDGYFQSERYFVDASEALREELEPPAPRTNRGRELAQAMESSDSISVHVRRGDYVSSPVAREMLGTCGVDYYQRAIAWLSRRVGEPSLFVFSDEPEWARENLQLPFETTHLDRGTAHEDLTLMSCCRHHVIANSSFSWWGAWLARDSGHVVAPRRWFAREDLSSRDLVPARWVRL